MMIKFHEIEVPIAKSMIELAEQALHPFQKYFSFWAAFNNIYTLVAKNLARRQSLPNGDGLISRLSRDDDGEVKFSDKPEFWGYSFPKVSHPNERIQIRETNRLIDNSTKNTLIRYSSVSFFAKRTPKGVPGKEDTKEQLINGVLNITRTVESKYPVWSPIDLKLYEDYIQDKDTTTQDILSEQIVFMLYTIRNNLVHGSKNMGEANDIEVVEKALPLLEIVVRSFIR